MAAATGPGGGGLSISRKLRRRSRAIYGVLAAALAVSIASAAVLLVGYRPEAARDAKAVSGLVNASSAVQQQRSVVLAALASPGNPSRPLAAAERALKRADSAVLTSGVSGRRVLDDLIAVNASEQAWTAWLGQIAQVAQAGGSGVPGPLIGQGDQLFSSYRTASNRAVADLTVRYDDALAHERTVVIYWLAVGGALVLVAGLLVAWTRRRVAKTTSAAVGSLLQSVRRIEAGDVVDLRALEAPQELAELSRVVVGLALELDSVRGAVGASSSRGEDRARRLTQVLELTQTISGHLSVPAVLSAIASAAVELTGAERASVWVAEEEGLRAGATAGAGILRRASDGTPGGSTGTGPTTGEPNGSSEDPEPSGPVAQAASYGRTIRHADGRLQQLVVPMTSGGRVLGVVDLWGRDIAGMPDDDVSLVETLASHGASAIGVAREHGVAESMSMTDPLTHLPNRRQLDHDLATECERARRYRRSSALVMMDVDGFKAFNDRHGHVAADQILAEFGRLLAESIRGSDSAYRFGGDEFVVLVREASVASAADLAERLRHIIADRFSVLPADAPVTASFGVVGVDQVDPEPATLLRAADEALYSAKERGRNRVVSFR